ncbi:MAG TPA: DUF6134 family protein [Gemmataceae bacterium]|nr:DUF6134 family protein [Gemmataceae bacterium]
MVRGLLGSPRRGLLAGWFVAASAIASGCVVGRAAEVETRDFAVMVDGDKSGAVHMTISRQDDGAVAFSCDTDVRVGGIITFYKYSYRGKELWKDGRLLHFESKCNDNGKLCSVTATAAADGLHVSINGSEHMSSADSWLTSYWGQPDAKLNGRTVPIIDADCGRDLDAKVEFVGAEKLSLAGQDMTTQHVRLSGKNVGIDLWFDQSARLVRQEWVEDGHRTIVELSGVRR